MNMLKAIGLYKSRINFPEVQRIIEEAVNKKAWLIFYTHDIEDNFSPFGCNPIFFRKVLEQCANHKLEVLTIKETIKKYL